MYKKTNDRHHLHQRTASHATKGGARGTPWFDQLSDEEKELIEIRRAFAVAHDQLQKIREARLRAKASGNKQLTREYSEQMRQLIKNAKKIERERGVDATKFHW